MKTSAGKFPISRLALVAAMISTALLLLTAASAQGEAAGDGLAPLAAVTESSDDAAPTEQEPAPAPAPAPPAEVTDTPVETQELEGPIESAGAAVESVAAAPSQAAAASEPVREAAAEAVHAATGAVSSAATTGAATTVVTATGDDASKLLGEVGQVTAKAAVTIDDQARQLSGLPLPEGGSAKKVADVTGVTGFGDPPQTERLPQPAGTSPSGVLASPGESPLAVSPAVRGKTPSVNSGGEAVAASSRGFAGAQLTWLGALESLGIQPTPGSGATGTRSNDPAPPDGPPPAPGPSGTAAGSTGSFFVPLAALLALLALVAPAVLRRLGEVPAFRPPTPFVCALERPG